MSHNHNGNCLYIKGGEMLEIHTSAKVLTENTESHGWDIECALTEHREGIVKYCYSLLLDYHEAQDAAQDVLLTAICKAASLRDRSKIGIWLYRIAYNTCMNIIKRKKLFNLFLQKEAAQTNSHSHEDSYSVGISKELRSALNTLSHRDRALVYNRVVDEMDYGQLEEIYGVKANTLRKRYERARKKLEEKMKG